MQLAPLGKKGLRIGDQDSTCGDVEKPPGALEAVPAPEGFAIYAHLTMGLPFLERAAEELIDELAQHQKLDRHSGA